MLVVFFKSLNNPDGRIANQWLLILRFSHLRKLIARQEELMLGNVSDVCFGLGHDEALQLRFGHRV